MRQCRKTLEACAKPSHLAKFLEPCGTSSQRGLVARGVSRADHPGDDPAVRPERARHADDRGLGESSHHRADVRRARSRSNTIRAAVSSRRRMPRLRILRRGATGADTGAGVGASPAAAIGAPARAIRHHHPACVRADPGQRQIAAHRRAAGTLCGIERGLNGVAPIASHAASAPDLRDVPLANAHQRRSPQRGTRVCQSGCVPCSDPSPAPLARWLSCLPARHMLSPKPR